MKWATAGVLLVSLVGCRSVNGVEEPVIRVELSLPRSNVAHGEPVGVNVRITNPGEREVLVETGCAAIFRVRDALGRVVYPFHTPRGVICLTPHEPLAAGASITKRLVWPTHRVSPTEANGVVILVDPGVYEISAAVHQSLTARDVESPPQSVTIAAPTG